MKETHPAAMPNCFDKWCQRFDHCFKTKAQKREFRNYLGGLLGESERKNLSQIAENNIKIVYNRLHHFITEAPWKASEVNEVRLSVMNKCSQSRISRGFALIVDDTGHRKSGNFTAGVGRQYIGEIGKTDNGVVTVTTHLYDGKKNLPLDIELYQPASSLPEGKEDKEFKKKPELAMELIEKTLSRGYRPGIVLIDSGYGNNKGFLQQLEEKKLKYIGGVAKNRKVYRRLERENCEGIRLDEIAKSLPSEAFKPVNLNLDKPKTVWVAIVEARTGRQEHYKTFAIVMNANCFEKATDIDYLITNVEKEKVTEEWVAKTYSQRNWVEVFYREAKGWLGLKEYQVRVKTSLERHFILVFCAYSFILWQKLTGGLRRQWANKPLRSFTDALEAFRTAMSSAFIAWLNENRDVFVAYKASLGFIWR
ncbi:MAG: IS701 family transposase [Coleofasciculus sp. G1-WW12-02]|uniref:IS701 family transposase n=1 Tax=Coleofasciculus sp. G1-WW12-02 TaxID=3068483 RepID=UPI0032FB9047